MIFKLPYLRKSANGVIRLACQLIEVVFRGAPDEGVVQPFFVDPGANCELSSVDNFLALLHLLVDDRVIRLDILGEFEIGQGVFVGTEHQSLMRQIHQLLQREKELFCSSPEEPATPANEQSVRTEQDGYLGARRSDMRDYKADMVFSMAWRIHAAYAHISELHRFQILHCLGVAGYSIWLQGASDDVQALPSFLLFGDPFQVASNVIWMLMR